VSIIRSQQLIDSVMQTDEWVATGEGQDEKAIGRFWRALEVRHPPRTELIQVSYRHSDPEVATTAVRQMIRAYRAHQGQQSTEERIQGLIKGDAELTEKLESIRREITDIASLHGTTDLARLFNMQMMALTETESAFRNMRMDLIIAETSVTEIDDFATLQEEEIARFDALMMSYIQKRDHLENELVIWRSRYTEEMPGRARLESEYEDIQRRIDDRRHLLISSGELELSARAAGASPTGPGGLKALRDREQQVRAIYEKDRKLTLKIGMDDLRVQTLQGEADLVQKRLEEIKGRVEQLRVESSVIGKINVISEGDRPLTPMTDRRRVMAAAGGLAGAGLAVAAVIGWGLFERRVRYSDELAPRLGVPLIGLIPDVECESGQHYPTDAVVRDIRWRLEHSESRHSRLLRTVAVAGEKVGAGTSSVTLALGISFAASGTATAIVDLGTGSKRIRARTASPKDLETCADSDALAEIATGIHNLTLVDPIGHESMGKEFSRARIARILDDLQSRFELVLIDCGSLGDPDGVLPACSIADGSILVCQQGACVSDLENAVGRLRCCGADLLGAVFNRAKSDDMPRHVRNSAVSLPLVLDDRFGQLGPLAATMMQNQNLEITAT
jgi:uncharacterized protein involved in exopolysaccharide biosynthesis/Mrp family chromosome partitioning ATPase